MTVFVTVLVLTRTEVHGAVVMAVLTEVTVCPGSWTVLTLTAVLVSVTVAPGAVEVSVIVGPGTVVT